MKRLWHCFRGLMSTDEADVRKKDEKMEEVRVESKIRVSQPAEVPLEPAELEGNLIPESSGASTRSSL